MDYRRFIGAQPAEALFGLGASFSTSCGQTFFISIFVPYFISTLPITAGEFGSLYGFGTLLGALALPFIAAKYDSTPLAIYTRRVFWGMGCASLLLALTVHPVMLVLAISGLRLTGPGLVTHVANTTMAKGFERRRGLALGLTSLGYPIGEGLLPPLAASALLIFDWRILWGGIAVLYLTAIPAAFTALIKRTRFESFVAEDYSGVPKKSGNALRQAWQLMRREPRFWRVMPLQALLPMLMTAVFLFQAPLAEHKGWSLTYTASLFTLYAACRAATSIWIGPKIDQLGAKNLVGVMAIPATIGLAAMAFSSATTTAAFYFVMAGVTSGAAGNIFSATWAELYGAKQLGAIKGLMGSFAVICSAIGPVLAGVLLELDWSFETILMLFAAMMASGVVWALPISLKPGPRPVDHSPPDQE